MADATHGEQYFYNMTTGQVESGRQSSWEHLMGPYASAAEASKAMETAREKSDAWDDDDTKWREGR